LHEGHIVIVGYDCLAPIFDFGDVYGGDCLLECRRDVEGVGCEFASLFSKGQQLPGQSGGGCSYLVELLAGLVFNHCFEIPSGEVADPHQNSCISSDIDVPIYKCKVGQAFNRNTNHFVGFNFDLLNLTRITIVKLEVLLRLG